MRTFAWMIGLLLAAGPASAHILEGTVQMTVAAETPAPTGTSATTAGTATFEVEDDLTLQYTVQVTDLTGPAVAAHIHEGAPGVAGGIIIPLTVSGGSISGTTAPLTQEQVTKLQNGSYYVNVHTGTNPLGEIRGQITLTAVRGTCSCQDLSKRAFRKCVNQEIKKLDKAQKKSKEVRDLKKAVAKSSCGLASTPRKKKVACCLPANDVATIVTGELCAPAKTEAQCTKFGGTVVTSTTGCAPTNPCSPPASPSGAFID